MPSLYPHTQLLQIKPKERLSDLISELKLFQEFYGADKLLQQAQCLINQFDAQIEEIYRCIDQIKHFIKLNTPLKEKLDQISYLMECVKYSIKSEGRLINSELDIQKKQLEQLRSSGFDKIANSENIFSELDLIFVSLIEELFNKIKETYSVKRLNSAYQGYVESKVESIQSINEDQKTKLPYLLQKLDWLMKFLSQLEYSYQQFNELKVTFENVKEEYSKLCPGLINLQTICDIKNTIEQQIDILNKDFSDYDPSVNFPQQLELVLTPLVTKLNELSAINQVELRNQQEQYTKLVELLINSKADLTMHANKLKSNFLWAQSGKNKYQAIEKIQQKMDALLESGTKHVSKQIITDLQQTINDAKTILSVYRGIPSLRCFATMWGGGKVTSLFLVQNLEEQLADWQSNINRLHT